MKHPRPGASLCLAALGLASSSCSLFGLGGELGAAACPALRPGADPLAMRYAAQAALDAKVKTFVQAATDLGVVSAQIEAEATAACRRMGQDLGLSPAQTAPQRGHGGAASGACGAVAARINTILRQGASVQVTVQPPACQANAQARARCAGACNVQVDAQCRASCEAHADVHGSCQPAVVAVRPSSGLPATAQLAATLQANLPQLLHAEITLGRRLIRDAQVVAQIGAELPRLVGNAGAQAVACVGAAADMAASASVRIQVSVQASASVSGQVGVQ